MAKALRPSLSRDKNGLSPFLNRAVLGLRLYQAFSAVRNFVAGKVSGVSGTELQTDCGKILQFQKDHPGFEGDRAFMHTMHLHGRVCALRTAALLSDNHLAGLFLHEFGHLISKRPGEDMANEAVSKVFGIRITYVGPLELEWVSDSVVRRVQKET